MGNLPPVICCGPSFHATFLVKERKTMRKLVIFALLLFSAGLVSSQNAPPIANPSAVKISRPAQKLAFETASKPVTEQRYWYWEVDDSIRAPFPTYRYLPGTMTHNDGFAPISLSWTFSGKHPLLPTLELAGMQIKPGERMTFLSRPSDSYGTVVSEPGSLWNKASHVLLAALRY
jgi:hypothetical protein